MLCVHVCHCVRELLTVDFGLRLVQLKLFVEQVIYNLEEVMVTTTLTDIELAVSTPFVLSQASIFELWESELMSQYA